MSLQRNVQTKHSANGIHSEHFAFEICSLWGCIERKTQETRDTNEI